MEKAVDNGDYVKTEEVLWIKYNKLRFDQTIWNDAVQKMFQRIKSKIGFVKYRWLDI